ncbi:MAG TPA: terminase small subunit [Sphingobacteriaceae bacterium]
MSEDKLTLKQRRFIDEYMVDFNGTRAARDAGFSKNTAAEIAYEYLRKPHIKAEVDRRLEEGQLGPDQTGKMIADIAKGNMNNYMIVRKAEFVPRVKKGLAQLIAEIEEEISFEAEYAASADLNEEEMEEHIAHVNRLEKKKLRYKLELKRNSKAFRIVDGEPQLIETAELDLAALARDKENGKIKSYKVGKDGSVQVELYPADAALDKIARMHSMYKDKLDVNMSGNVDPEKWLELNNTGEQA